MPAQPIKAACSRQYTAVHHSGARSANQVRWIVIHDTEGDTAQGAAAWFQNPASSGSAHLCVDDLICYRTLSNLQVPWAAPGANVKGFHIELAGYAAWTAAQWRSHDATLRRAAFKTALHCRLFGIPPTFRWAGGLEDGKPGVTTHAQCSRAFGGDHTDPGSGWPQQLFMELVRGYYVDLAGNGNV